MKRKVLVFAVIAFMGISLARVQLFPKVDKPPSDYMSMLAVLFIHENDGEYEIVSNTNFSG